MALSKEFVRIDDRGNRAIMMDLKEFADKVLHTNIINDKAVDAWHQYFRDEAKVGDGATVCLYTDRTAYTIIKRTPKSLTLRRCKAIRKFTPEWIPGGFSAICTNNNDQEWEYEEDEKGRVVKAYWSDKYCRFRNNSLTVIPGRHEWFDYNF